MKKYLYFSILSLIATNLLAQNESDSTVTLDILRAPSSPAANLLGISNSQIERPSDPTSFMATIYQASNSLSSMPSNFAIDFAPAWVWGGKKITFDKYISDSAKHSIPQSLVISLATKSVDSLGKVAQQNPYKTQFSAGFKVSIFRGHIVDQVLLNAAEAKRIELLNNFSKAKEKIRESDKQYKLIKKKLTKAQENHNQDEIIKLQDSMKDIEKRINERVTENSDYKSKYKALKDDQDNIKLNRYGFKLDFSGALVWDFPKQNYGEGKLTKAGVWLTGGWDIKNGLSTLFIARYQYNPDQIFADDKNLIKTANNSTLDFGGRVIYSSKSSPFSLSSEAIYRSVNNSLVKPTWRVTLNAEYDFSKNKKLTFIFGRDFDGTVTKDGNLIAALNLLLGFGSKKNIL